LALAVYSFVSLIYKVVDPHHEQMDYLRENFSIKALLVVGKDHRKVPSLLWSTFFCSGK
jgi:hypothetical protein